MDKIWLIIKREYLTRVKKKSFIIMTLLGPLLMAGAIALITYLGMSDSGPQHILVVDDMAPVFDRLEDGDNYTFDYSDISLVDAKKLFPESEYTAILWIPEIMDGERDSRPFLYFKEQPSGRTIRSMESKIEQVIEEMKMAKYGISKADYKKVRTNLTMATFKFTEDGSEEEVMSEKTIVGFGFGILIYMFIFMYGVQVMKGVIEEKTNRIVEVIITSVKPFQLMMGKILGLAMVGLTQFLLWIVLTFSFIILAQTVILNNKQDAMLAQMEQIKQVQQIQAGQVAGADDFNAFDITDPDNLINRIDWTLMISMFIFYFLGGYLLYAALFAAIGAAVDNETDSQQFMLPVTAPLIAAYAISAMMIENPGNPAAFWGSIIPFTSPIIMMVRVSMGIEASQYWELALSMVLLIVGFLATTWLAAKIYRVGILMYGKKVNYKELWKWLRYH
ncbi:MAG: ABC-2 type transport system permease protein [Salibacteraceae bacterium]|jgi:ABC-2 type transport system permease protein